LVACRHSFSDGARTSPLEVCVSGNTIIIKNMVNKKIGFKIEVIQDKLEDTVGRKEVKWILALAKK
jgi:hypothetical protein